MSGLNTYRTWIVYFCYASKKYWVLKLNNVPIWNFVKLKNSATESFCM